MSQENIPAKVHEPIGLPKFLLGFWLLLTATLLFGMLAMVLMLLPEIVRGTMFADTGAAVSLAVLVVPSVCISMYGFIKDWYFSWLIAKLSYQLAAFFIGLAIVITIFTAPFTIVGAIIVVGQFAILKWALVCNTSLDSREMREQYSVIKYSHY